MEYANLAIRGLRMKEIWTSQFADALAMGPDLLSVFGGMNDVIAPRCDFDSIRAEYVIIFGQARHQGAMVLSFTVPDLSAINPLGVTFRDRVAKLNDIIRTEAERRDVVVMDFEAISDHAGSPSVVRGSAARQRARPSEGGGRLGVATRRRRLRR